MNRTKRFSTICHALAAMFLLIGITRLATAALPLIDPRLSTVSYECEPCALRTDPVLLLESSQRAKAWQTPGSAERIVERIRLPKVKLMLFVDHAVRAIPFFFLFLGLAMALRSFARMGFNHGGVLWLKRSALAAMVWALAQPVATSIRHAAFSPITLGREMRQVVLSGDSLIFGLLIGGAAWVTLWALDQALTMQRDLEGYV